MMDEIIEMNGKKYIKMYQNMFGYKDHLDKDHNIVRECYIKPLTIVPYEKTYIINGELYAEFTEGDDIENNLV